MNKNNHRPTNPAESRDASRSFEPDLHVKIICLRLYFYDILVLVSVDVPFQQSDLICFKRGNNGRISQPQT